MENGLEEGKITRKLWQQFRWEILMTWTKAVVVTMNKLCPTLLQPHGLWPAGILCPWDFPGKNTRVGCHFLSPGDLPDPGIEPMSLNVSCIGRQVFTTSITWEVIMGQGTDVENGEM